MGLDLDFLAAKQQLDLVLEKLSDTPHGEREEIADKIINICDLILKDEISTDNIGIIWSDKINRVEVIDENGRSYTKRNIKSKVGLSYQDNNETLKIFI